VRVREEFVKQAEELSPVPVGGLSLTQYQFISLRLNGINDQMAGIKPNLAGQ